MVLVHYQVEAPVAHEEQVLQRVHQGHEAERAPAQHEPEAIHLHATGRSYKNKKGVTPRQRTTHLDIGRVQVPAFPVEEFGDVRAHERGRD